MTPPLLLVPELAGFLKLGEWFVSRSDNVGTECERAEKH